MSDIPFTKEEFEKLARDIEAIRQVGHEHLRLGAILANSLWELENALNTLRKIASSD